MRIRKNRKLSSLIFSQAFGAEAEHTYGMRCQLNQSPWDVIPFSEEVYPSSNQHFEGEDSFIENGSSSDFIGAVESIASMMESKNKAMIMKANKIFIDDTEMPKVSKAFKDNEEMKIDREFRLLGGEKLLSCKKSDGKGWQCKNVPKDGHSFCDHHLTLLKSHNNNPSIKKHEKSVISRRGRPRVAKKGSSSTSNPYEFYYYSGFGPSWGKRRSNTGSEGSKSKAKDLKNSAIDNNIASNKTPMPSSSSQIDNSEEFDYDTDIEDDEDEENGDGGKKRMRKPMKARSLKSLM